jgi:hypothetical protein
MSVTIAWKNKKFEVPVHDQNGNPAFHKATLRYLIEHCSILTDVPHDRIKLLMSGGEPYIQPNKTSPSSSSPSSPNQTRHSPSGYQYQQQQQQQQQQKPSSSLPSWMSSLFDNNSNSPNHRSSSEPNPNAYKTKDRAEKVIGSVGAGMQDFVSSVGRGMDEFVTWVTGNNDGQNDAEWRRMMESGSYGKDCVSGLEQVFFL